MATAQWIDAHTPTLSVVDSRGLAVRNVGYHCHPLNSAFESRINRNQFDPAGRLVASWDPRLWGMAPKPNLDNTLDFQGRPLLVDSVDAGWQLSLLDQAGSPVSMWDGRGSQRHTTYDALLRPVAVMEQMAGERPRVSDRFAYAAGDHGFAIHNQCGQLLRHDHPVGRRDCCDYGIGGLLLTEQMRFLADFEPVDWSADHAEDRLETEVFQTSQHYGPAGDMRRQTDALHNVRFFTYDRAGQLRDTRLKLADSSEAPCLLVSEINYDALGRGISERAGNGVITTAGYAAEDGRLLQLQSCHADGHVLQDFHYGYHPVGNIIRIEDRAQSTSHFNNQRLDPVCRYGYDSLYQLIEATGCEVSQPSHGPALPAWQTTPLDPNQLRHYTQTFHYDAAGNLQTRHHSGAERFEMFTAVSSNRSVAEEASLADGFDANGNQIELLRGQQMRWNIRNELSGVTRVKREDGPDDTEHYYYDQPGHRMRKVRLTHLAGRSLRAETRYLPGLEIHRDTATEEERHVISIEAGRSSVRALHWVTTLPRDVRNDQLRYCLSNHLNSNTLELDEQGGVLSREVYYPFGGTALWAGVGEIEAKYKTIRYSGKERDTTGLYYYGYRYYAPWLQRWVSPDPAGVVDGLNVFVMLFNNPVNWVDAAGTTAVPTIAHFFWGGGDIQPHDLANVLRFKELNPEYQIKFWTEKPSHILNTLSAMETGDGVNRFLANRFGHDLEFEEPHDLFREFASISPGAFKLESLFQRESNGPYRNLAAASDILRMVALHVYGGLYMDVDTSTKHKIPTLEASSGFMALVRLDEKKNYPVDNFTSVIAAPRGSLTPLIYLEFMIKEYEYDEPWLPNKSWTDKRAHGPSRFDMTMRWTGPVILRTNGFNPYKPGSIINDDWFGHRVPSEQTSKCISRDDPYLRDFRPTTGNHDHINGWSVVKPGRRASVA